MLDVQIKPFDLSKEKEILDFAQKNPCKPNWSQEHIKEFINMLTTSSDLVFDLYYSHNNRIAVAVLIDNIKNKGNNACLEFVGLDRNCDFEKVYSLVIQLAKTRLPKTLLGIEITLHESLIEIIKLVLDEGFTSYYDTYEMICNIKELTNMLQSECISSLTENDFAEYYDVIVQSFKDNPEMSIPSFDEWKSMCRDPLTSQTLLYREVDKIVGFINLEMDLNNSSAEIRTVGVMPNERGKGIGRKLLSYGLSYLSQRQINTCHLTVATQNMNALNLYKDLEFLAINHYKVFCWKVNRSVKASAKVD